MNKKIKAYQKIYRKALVKAGVKDIDAKADVYAVRLSEMYASDNFKKHNVYPSTSTPHVYAVIAMCLELKNFGLSDSEIMDTINSGFVARRTFFNVIIAIINLLPNSFDIARKWNVGDHEKRVADGSITYDYFNVTRDKVEYRISKCMYVEMFETYGIRPLCKIFCNTDTRAYSGLTRHVEFIRHSDLSDGPACHDEVIRKC
ncbi:L-2-amino-thiazoline-4-carboxylic acid hydrolase [Butyrivibrio hungatei]|uniref:ATC hydrolase family protein n=1 Tax=Butyrivibrio hungatei TaxID=185008 RepID=A0A1D9NY16_9FIRM|nr:L-2-amino-thiazoline-4-carboxylic acid hydrolase [Butyrivibrio hungatei]AOZ95278.1 ATC hydrolase family protein [Butyrivibrio hungatei]